MEKEIGKINKGEYQGTVTDIIVAVREYNGKPGVDIREHVSSEGYTGPTKKGLRIPAEKFAEFKRMIDSINESDLQPSGEGSSESSPAEKPATPKGQEELPDY